MPCFFALYFLAPRQARNFIALGGSILFYAWGAPLFIFVLTALAFATFYLVQWMHRQIDPRRKKQLLVIAITLNIGMLAYFKYANFFVENFNSFLHALGIGELTWTEVALPVGISFFTFQKLTYCIDVYRGQHAPLKRFHDFLLFALIFPQLVAGPIVRYTLVADELTGRKETSSQVLAGFFRFTIGLSKKVLIANVLGNHASAVIDSDFSSVDGADAWIAIIAYTFQIYFDFSGYSDMAIGLALMMGFHFPENFNNPYLSKSITEFWKRWHMTLGNWMRDYLYIPLGGNRVSSNGRLYFNLVFVFLISGLWHGASWNFIFWGGFHGLFLVLDRLFLLRFLNRTGALFSTTITFFIVMHGWIFFRIEDFQSSFAFLSKMYSFGNIDQVSAPNWHFRVILISAAILSVICAFRFGKAAESWIYTNSQTPRIAKQFSQVLIALMLVAICLAGITSSGFNPFIYFRF